MLTLFSPAITAQALEDAAAYLRLPHDEEAALISGLLTSALRQCEQFCGQLLWRRPGSEIIRISGTWQMLSAQPLRFVTAVSGLTPDGEAVMIPRAAYTLEIDDTGAAWIRIDDAQGTQQAKVTFEAGLADRWGDIDAPLRQGMLRLVAHMHAHRDDPAEGGLPLPVIALWRAFHQLRLGGRRVA